MALQEDLLAFLDTETTGLEEGVEEVCEIATIITDLNLKEVARIEMKVQVEKVVPPQVAAINGYDKQVWEEEAKPFSVWMDWISKQVSFGHVAIPIGHNVGYDYNMIKLKYYKPKKKFFPLSYHKVDTVGFALVLRMVGILKSDNLKLATVTKALNIKHENTHRAMSDCEASKALFEMVVGRLTPF